MSGDTAYPFETNLVGAYNCLELARRDGAQVVFLSTSRVYPYPALNQLRLREDATRLELEPEQEVGGVSPAGISESFPLDGPRTLYGATKLAAELLVTEYAANFGLRTVVNRCGVIAGPWQMGRVDQGVFTFWLLHHHFGRPLTYIGYGGAGRQVRDLLHVDDLVELVDEQLTEPERWDGFVGNVGGGREISLSLLRDDGDLPRAHRERGPDRALRRRAPGRRSAIPLRLLPPVREHRLATGSGGRGRYSPTSWAGSENTRTTSPRRSASSDEAVGRDAGPQRGRLDRRDDAAARSTPWTKPGSSTRSW